MRVARIAVVDDDLTDRMAIRRAFETAGILNELIELNDGAALLESLENAAAADLPDLVLLDLNMPRLDGHGVMERLRENPAWASIPVVVLTASDDPEDIRRSYLDGAATYIAKPVDVDGIRRVARALPDYGIAVVRRE